MKFSWLVEGSYSRPICSSNSSDDSSDFFISHLLGDDGGVGLSATIDWVDEGVQILESVVAGRVPHADWDREHWGTHIDVDRVEIYFLFQEDYSKVVETSAVQKALVAWQEFLRNGSHGVDGSLNELDLDL